MKPPIQCLFILLLKTKEMKTMIKNKLQAKCQKLQPKSEANPRRPDTSTERVTSNVWDVAKISFG